MKTNMVVNMIGTIGYSIIFEKIVSVYQEVVSVPSSLGSEMSGTKFKSSRHHGEQGSLKTHSRGSSLVQRSHSLKSRFGHLVKRSQ